MVRTTSTDIKQTATAQQLSPSKVEKTMSPMRPLPQLIEDSKPHSTNLATRLLNVYHEMGPVSKPELSALSDSSTEEPSVHPAWNSIFIYEANPDETYFDTEPLSEIQPVKPCTKPSVPLQLQPCSALSLDEELPPADVKFESSVQYTTIEETPEVVEEAAPIEYKPSSVISDMIETPPASI